MKSSGHEKLNSLIKSIEIKMSQVLSGVINKQLTLGEHRANKLRKGKQIRFQMLFRVSFEKP